MTKLSAWYSPRPQSTSGGHSTPRANRKAQNIIIGKKVSEGLRSWRGADLTVNLYLGYFDISTTAEDIRYNIEDQNVSVVSVDELQTQHNKFKSFKLCIRKKDLPIMQSDNFELPEGTVVRYFFAGKNRDGAPISSTTKNGS